MYYDINWIILSPHEIAKSLALPNDLAFPLVI